MDEILKGRASKCQKSLRKLKDAIGEKNKFPTIHGLIVDILEAFSEGKSIEELHNLCEKLSDEAVETNNLDVRNQASTFASNAKKVEKRADYTEFLEVINEGQTSDDQKFWTKDPDFDPEQLWGEATDIYFNGGDIQRAIQIFTVFADIDFARAYSFLGDIYYYGKAGEKDYAKAFQYYKKGAEKDDQWCQLSLYYCYYNGYGVTKNEATAVEWLEKSVAQKLPQAMNQLASYLIGIKRADYSRAFKLAKEAYDAGYKPALVNMSFCYLTGNGISKNIDTSEKLIKEARDCGVDNTEWMFDLIRQERNANKSTFGEKSLSPQGQKENEQASRELEEELARLFGESTTSTNSPRTQKRPQQTSQPSPQPTPQSTGKKKDDGGGFCGCLIWIIIAAAIYWGYKSCTGSGWSLFGGSNKEVVSTPSNYVIAETLNLRSSSEKTRNVIGKLSYGTSVSVRGSGSYGSWINISANGQTGYVSHTGIVNETEFNALNNIWGDNATRRMVAELRNRHALISLATSSNFDVNYKLYGLENKGNNVWRSKSLGTNGVLAVILDNKSTGGRMAALFSFDKADNPVLQFTENVNTATTYIKKVSYRRKQYKIEYGKYKTSETINESQITEMIDDGEQDYGSPNDGLLGSLPNGTTVYEGDMDGFPIRFTITKDESRGEIKAVYKNVNYGSTMTLTGESLPAQGGDIYFFGTLSGQSWAFNLTGNRNSISGTANGDNKQFTIHLRPQ